MANFSIVVEDPSCRDSNVLGQVACADRTKIRGVESQKKHVFRQQKNIDKLWFNCLTINLQHVLDLLKLILDFSIGKSIWGIILLFFGDLTFGRQFVEAPGLTKVWCLA
jgi:hypothetical protein